MSHDDKTVRILRYIEDYWQTHGYSPSLREIQTGCGISSLSVVTWNLGKLEKRGEISRTPDIARSITLAGRAGW